METIKKPKFEDFTLLKFKYKDGKAEIEWTQFEDGVTDKWNLERVLELHEKLTQLINELKPFVMDYYSFNSIKKIMGATERLEEKHLKAFETVESLIEKDVQLKKEAINITGISLKGKNKQVVITAVYDLEDRKGVPVNAYYNLESEKFGTETELEEVITAMKHRVIALVFDKEKGQGNLFDED